jgi:phage-related protein
MAREFIMGARINLTDNFTKPVSSMKKMTDTFKKSVDGGNGTVQKFGNTTNTAKAKVDSFGKEVDQSTKALKKQATATKQAGNGMKGLVAAAGAYFSIRGIVHVASEWVGLAKEQIKAETRLQKLMSNVPGTTQKGIDAVKSYASELQGLTTVGDEVAITGASQLATFQLQEKNIKSLMPAMNDLAVGTYGVNVSQEQMIQSGNMIGKVLSGQVGALSRIGITFDKNQEKMLKHGTEAEKVAALVDVIKQNYGGLAEEMAKTDEGKIIQFKNAWGDMKEMLGMELLPILGKVAGWAQTKIPQIQKLGIGMLKGVQGGIRMVSKGVELMQPVFSKVSKGFSVVGKVIGGVKEMMLGSGDMTKLADLFGLDGAVKINNALWDIVDAVTMAKDFIATTAAPAISAAFNTVKTAVTNLATYFITNFSKFKPYIIGIGTALLTYYTYLKLVQVGTKLWAAAQAAFNAVMAMNPVMLVIIAIGLLIGYLIHLAGGWDVVKQKLLALWPVMVSIWNNIKAVLMPIFQTIGQKAVEIWQYLVQVVPPILMQLWQTVVQWFTAIWNAISPLLTTVWNGVVTIFNAIKAFWDQWGAVILASLSVYFAGIVSIFKSMLTIAWNIVKGVFTFISEIISGTFKIISGIVQVGFSIVTGIFSTALNLLSGNWSGAWDSMLGMLKGVWSGLKDFFSGLKDLFYDSGVAIIKTLVDGIKSMAMAPVKAVGSMFKKVRDLLPFSDAKKGPLSQLTHNGGKIVTTLAEGVKSKAGTLHDTMTRTLNGVPNSVSGTANINAAGNPTAGSGDRQTIIRSLIEKIIIQGAEGKDGKALAEEIIEALYEKLQGADDILSDGDLGALL